MATESRVPAETRARTSTAWTGSGSSSPPFRSTWSNATRPVVRPMSLPSRTSSPLTLALAANPRVGRSAGASLGCASPSNLHSVLGSRAASTATRPSTRLSSNASTSRKTSGAFSDLQLEARRSTAATTPGSGRGDDGGGTLRQERGIGGLYRKSLPLWPAADRGRPLHERDRRPARPGGRVERWRACR